MKKNKPFQSTYQEKKKHYVLIKDFKMFMYHEAKRQHRKHFCTYCL